MALAFSTTLRTARAQAIITAAGASAKMKFYDGTRPASGAAITSQTLLGTMTAGATLGTATSGTLDFDESGFTQSNGSHVNGTPTWVRITTSADVFVADLSIGSDMTFTGTISTGVNITLNASTITEGNA
jgi:hypothetical protein